MKYLKLISLALCTIPALLISQDVIVLKTAEEIKSKVVELTDLSVKYKKWENLNGPIYNINKSEVLFIRYENGMKEVFNGGPASSETLQAPQIQTIKTIPNVTNINSEIQPDDSIKGNNDAIKHYHGQNSGMIWTGVTAFLASPIVALIPGFICSSTIPSDENLNFPDNSLKDNELYYKAYRKKAHKIKKQKIWNVGWSIGTIAWAGLILITL